MVGVNGRWRKGRIVDAMRLCADAYTDERRLLACMKANRSLLGAGCLTVADAGVKRRHL